MLRQLRSVRESLDADCAATIKELPKLCVKIVLIADWSVAHFVVIMMTTNTKWATDQSAIRAWPCMNIVILTHNLGNSPMIQTFVLSRVDYCRSLLVTSPRTVTDKHQRVMNAADRVITKTGNFERGLSSGTSLVGRA